MTEVPADGLRDLVAAMVRDVVTELVATSVRDEVGSPQTVPTPLHVAPPVNAPLSSSVTTINGGRQRSETVRIHSDAELDAFVRHLLHLFENPKNRQDLRAGRHRFTLAAVPMAPAARNEPVCRIERGAVTERQITTIAESQQRLVLGRGAVLTPLARERARALGVAVEKEH